MKYECVRKVTDNGERGMERMVCLMLDHASPASAPLLQYMTSSLNFFSFSEHQVLVTNKPSKKEIK